MSKEQDKYAAQKKYLAQKKKACIWVNPDEYEIFKAKAKANGTSVYALFNAFIKDYIKD